MFALFAPPNFLDDLLLDELEALAGLAEEARGLEDEQDGGAACLEDGLEAVQADGQVSPGLRAVHFQT